METNLKFKVGDKVRVNSLKWYNENKDVFGDIILGKKFIFLDRMAENCGKVLEITEVCNDYYRTDGNNYVWQEWMLEDEAVNAKQEVEQLNKNSMEIDKKMLEVRQKITKASLQPITKEQARNLLVGTKFFCVNYADAEKLQRKLIECGCLWSDIGEKIDIERWAIFVCGDGFLAHQDKEVVSWSDDSYIAILIEDVLAIQIKEEEKPKFDPKTLRPFDKVLVREEGGRWLARFFDIYENGYYVTSGHLWTYCVPFNEETKHLHGTAEDAPEFYIGCEDF